MIEFVHSGAKQVVHKDATAYLIATLKTPQSNQ